MIKSHLLYRLSYELTCLSKNGASDRNRTGDNHVGNVMLYQLSYTRLLNPLIALIWASATSRVGAS